MGLFSKWFGSGRATEPPSEHAVIVSFTYGSTNVQPIFDLEDELERAINAAQAGQFDGNEVAVDGSDGRLYMYGPNADRLFAAVKPILESCSFMRGAKVMLRYGPPKDNVQAREVVVGS